MTHFHKSTQFAMLLILALAAGCNVLPQRRFKPTLHNPRMQLREVAIVPFLNRSGNPTVDGTEVAQLYANQTQRISGFNVTPVETVKQAMIDTKLMKFESVDDIRALGEYLNVDVVVLGTVNQYSSYQPPTITLETEWYATNPYFHPIVKGHGLPWGTPAEREIPDAILLEVEQDLARAQLATQTPDPKAPPTQPAAPQPLQLQNDWQPGMFPQTQPYGQPGAQPYGLPSTVPNMTQPDASYFPPSLSSVQNGDFNGGNIGGNVDGNRFTTAYYPQTNQFDTGYSNYYAEEEPVDAETQLYLQRQQQTMDEISLRAQGIFSRPKKTPKPDASRQYEPYETPPTLPSRRITVGGG